MPLLPLLPLLSFLLTFLLLFSARSAYTGRCWRASFLVASAIQILFVALSTEVLSALGHLGLAGVLAAWCAALLALAVLFARFGAGNLSALKRPPAIKARFSAAGLGALVVALVVLVLGFIAAKAAPNNWDSMTYHLSRVVHWIQNGSVDHYPTHIFRQTFTSPLAEYLLLHLHLLSGSDHLDNLVQWSCMVGCCVGVSLMTKQLGGTARQQALAAIFCVTIPMGILQATSTQNDYVNAYTLLIFVHSLLLFLRRSDKRVALLIGVPLGLALFTKGTAYLYAAPFALWLLVSVLRAKMSWTWKGAYLLYPLFCVLVINGGYFLRNIQLYDSPLGVKVNTSLFANQTHTPAAIASNIVRNTTLHLQTPSKEIKHHLFRAVSKLHKAMGQDLHDRRTTFGHSLFSIKRTSTHEDHAGNPLHLLSIFLCLALALVFIGRLRTSLVLPYLLSLCAAFVFFCVYLKWQPWHSRLHLPLFVLAAPVVSVVLGRTLPRPLILALATAMLLLSPQWILQNQSRPLLGARTIFNTPRESQYFANRPWLTKPYSRMAKRICEGRIRRLGLILGKNDYEYPLWVLLNRRCAGIRIHHVKVRNISGKLDRRRVPCDALLKINNKKGTMRLRKAPPECRIKP